MNKLIALTTLTSMLTFAGCGCSGFTGGGDRVYTRGSDMLVVCENGGFSAQLATGASYEGLQSSNADDSAVNGALGTSGARLFSLDSTTLAMTGLGNGTWTLESLDQTGLDHADVLCTDVATRAWWNTPAGMLPVQAKFSKPGSESGTIDTITLGSDGTLQLSVDGQVQTGTYDANVGAIDATNYGIDGVFNTDGTLVTTNFQGDGKSDTWQLVVSTAKVAAAGAH